MVEGHHRQDLPVPVSGGPGYLLSRLQLPIHRSEENTVAALVNGWFTFFGVPDEIVLDADGAFRGFRFEHLQAQSSVKVRFVPPDAHYQMGRTERHGQTVKHMVRRLVSQFAPASSDELSLLVVMSTTAKNALMNKSGSSPAQWVCGQNSRLPGALLSSGGSLEAAQTTAKPSSMSKWSGQLL